MRQELAAIRSQGIKIIFIDETVFTRKAMMKFEWARKHENMAVDEKLLNEPTKALLMGISAEKGVEQYRVFDRSVNIKKFIQYLQMVRDAHGEEPVALFMDNLSVHRSKKSKAKMEELNIRWVFNLPYQCELNPIELVFSKVKQKFKTQRAESLVRGKRPNIHTLIMRSVKCLKKEEIGNCIVHAQRLLEE